METKFISYLSNRVEAVSDNNTAWTIVVGRVVVSIPKVVLREKPRTGALVHLFCTDLPEKTERIAIDGKPYEWST